MRRTATRPTSGPVVIAVGLSSAFVKQHQETALHAGAVLKVGSLENLVQMALASRPVGLLTTDAFHVGNRNYLETVAHSVGARLIRLADEQVTALQLESAMRGAVLAQAKPG